MAAILVLISNLIETFSVFFQPQKCISVIIIKCLYYISTLQIHWSQNPTLGQNPNCIFTELEANSYTIYMKPQKSPKAQLAWISECETEWVDEWI